MGLVIIVKHALVNELFQRMVACEEHFLTVVLVNKQLPAMITDDK